MCASTADADWSDTPYSSERPPKSTAMFSFMEKTSVMYADPAGRRREKRPVPVRISYQNGAELSFGFPVARPTDFARKPCDFLAAGQMRVCTTAFSSADLKHASISRMTRIICAWVTSCSSSPRIARAMLR